MVNTKRFAEYGKGYDLEEKAMKKVNEFIQENRIERSDVLEFRTNKDVHYKSYIDNKFEVIMSWWS